MKTAKALAKKTQFEDSAATTSPSLRSGTPPLKGGERVWSFLLRLKRKGWHIKRTSKAFPKPHISPADSETSSERRAAPS